MSEKINIPARCSEQWEKMKLNSKGRHCGVCKTTVIDFTSMGLQEIQAYFRNNQNKKICGQYHDRHVKGKENKWFNFLNRIESNTRGKILKRAALLLINVLLLMSSCKTKRRTMGKFAAPAIPENKTETVIFQNNTPVT